MQKIIGLDLGSYSIKAVEIINNFSSYEIVNYYEKVIPAVSELPRDALIQHCLEELYAEHQINADRIVAAMPGQYISSRIMSFNFSDPRKIDAAVSSELEDIVPFDLDEMIVDQQIIGSLNSKTLVLVVMTKKNYLSKFLDNLKRINIDPKLIDIDSLAFYNLTSVMKTPEDRCIGYIDIGHEKTSICFVENGVLRMFRSINIGGKYITEFIARDMQISFQEAQRLKHHTSKISLEDNIDVGKQAKSDVAERIAIASNALVKEIGRTLYAFKTYEKSPVDTLYLSGGTANIVNYDKYLSDQLSLKVVMNPVSATSLTLHEDISADNLQMIQSVAVGMRAISSVKRVSSINLRKGEFAFVQDYEKLLKYGFSFLKISMVVMFLLSLSYVLHYFVYQAQIEEVQSVYRKAAVKSFPDLKSKVKNSNFKKVEDSVKKRFERSMFEKSNSAKVFIEKNNGSVPLVVLSKISEALKKDTVLDTTLFQYTVNKSNSGKLIFRAEVKDYATGTEVLESIKSVKVLKNVREKSSGTKPGTKLIDYTIHADLDESAKLMENM